MCAHGFFSIYNNDIIVPKGTTNQVVDYHIHTSGAGKSYNSYYNLNVEPPSPNCGGIVVRPFNEPNTYTHFLYLLRVFNWQKTTATNNKSSCDLKQDDNIRAR